MSKQSFQDLPAWVKREFRAAAPTPKGALIGLCNSILVRKVVHALQMMDAGFEEIKEHKSFVVQYCVLMGAMVETYRILSGKDRKAELKRLLKSLQGVKENAEALDSLVRQYSSNPRKGKKR